MPFQIAAAALGLVVLAPVALIAAGHSFDGLYGQDSFAYVDYALGPLTHSLRTFQPLPDFYWPPGYPLLVALVALPTGLDTTAGQLVSLFAGALVPILVALLARELMPGDERGRARWAVPLLAGLVVGLAGQLWQSSLVAMSDTTAVAAVTFGAWAACRYARTGSLAWLALSAAAIAFAIDVRLIYGLVAIPAVIVGAKSLIETWRDDPPKAAAHAATGALVATVIAAPAPALGAISAASASQSWNPVFALQNAVETLDGRFAYELPIGAFYLLQPLQPYWFSALAVLALPGIARVVRGRDAIQCSMLILWPALVLVFLAGTPYQNTRYFLAAAPPVAILISFGTLAVWRFLNGAPGSSRVAGSWRRIMLPAGSLVVGAALLSSAANATGFTNAFVDRVAGDSASIRALAALVPADARLITLGATAQLRHDQTSNVVELAGLDERATARLLADGRPTYLLIDRAAIASQWQTRAPAATVASIESAPGLREIGTRGIWTLYEIAPI